jgi:hypothetical protein
MRVFARRYVPFALSCVQREFLYIAAKALSAFYHLSLFERLSGVVNLSLRGMAFTVCAEAILMGVWKWKAVQTWTAR